MSKARYSEETKAQALAALKSGEGLCDVSRRLNVPKATLSDWAKRAGLDSEQIRTEKKENLADLVAGCLAANLVTLTAISEHARDKTWLKEQRADSLAMFYGVTADKAIRILEAHAAAAPVEVEK